MNCGGCCNSKTDSFFATGTARRDARRYQRKGPTGTTRTLLAGLSQIDARGATMLDIGGGVGALHHELLDGRFDRAIQVDAANVYLEVARSVAVTRGHTDRVEFRFGDVVELATDIPDSDLVTLDRVVCCYPDEVLLLSIASSKARRWLALSYPRNRFPMRVGIAAVNLFERVFGDGFRVFVRPEEHIRAEVMRHGFESRFEQQTVFWQVSVFERTRQHLLT